MDKLRTVNTLTSREREVIGLVAEGYSNEEIGEKLGISWRTVASHRSSIKIKLGIHTTAKLVKYAIKEGLANVDPTNKSS